MQVTTGMKKLGALLALGIAVCLGVVGSTLQVQAQRPATGIASALQASKIDPHVLQETANGKTTSFIIFMVDQANVSPAYSMKDQDARGWFVYNTLYDNAAKTQRGVRDMLNARGINYQPFWVANMIVVYGGDRSLVESLAARDDVARIDPNDA